MPCKPIDFLNLAKQLSSGKEEIDWRCAISRAYYAALHWADERKDLCPEIHLDTIKGGSHERIIQRYCRNTGSSQSRSLGYILQDMRNKRESADYELRDSFLGVDATQQVLMAQKVKHLLDALEGAKT